MVYTPKESQGPAMSAMNKASLGTQANRMARMARDTRQGHKLAKTPRGAGPERSIPREADLLALGEVMAGLYGVKAKAG